jgi:hypothetical protein
MMKWFSCGVIGLLLAGAVLSSGCTGSGQAGQNATMPPTTITPQRMTTTGLADLVKDAAGYAQSAGKQSAIAEFSKKEGKFSHGDVYLRMRQNGTLSPILASPGSQGRTVKTLPIRGAFR